MLSKKLTLAQQIKISCFSKGIRITTDAVELLTQSGKVLLSIHEYTTTGGITLKLEGGVYINAPFDEWFCNQPEVTLSVEPVSGAFFVEYKGETVPASVLPLPGYLDVTDSQGRFVKDVVMSHADRARLSPIYGCAYACKFCDFVGQRYVRRPADQLLQALNVARRDTVLPVKHVLISGGTPSPRDYGYFDDLCENIILHTDVPADVMMPPRRDGVIDRLTKWGIHGYAINLEIYDRKAARRIVPQKERLGLALFAAGIERAVELTGGNGRVRSLLVVGLEPLEQTLAGIEFLARLGCDPVLSPFRPARGTPLVDVPSPSTDFLERIYMESAEIAERCGVKLGPRCIPCQHNTLTFPDGSGAYYYS